MIFQSQSFNSTNPASSVLHSRPTVDQFRDHAYVKNRDKRKRKGQLDCDVSGLESGTVERGRWWWFAVEMVGFT